MGHNCIANRGNSQPGGPKRFAYRPQGQLITYNQDLSENNTEFRASDYEKRNKIITYVFCKTGSRKMIDVL
jgi:hypothetical protein